MGSKDQIDLAGVFPAIIEADSTSKRFALALDKIRTLGVIVLESNVEQNLFHYLKDVKVIVGNEKGESKEVFLFGILSKGDRSSLPTEWQLTEEETLNLVVFDMSLWAIQEIQHLDSQRQREKLKRIENNFVGYLKDDYLKKILAGRRVISGVKPASAWALNPYEEERGGEDSAGGHLPFLKLAATLVLFGGKETPANILFSEKLKSFLDQVMSAISNAMKRLQETFSDSFDYLIALIEEAVLARSRQQKKAPSKKTPEVQQDMGALFLNPLYEGGIYNNNRYNQVFSKDYDPFEKLECDGNAARRKRTGRKEKLLDKFRPLLENELANAFLEMEAELADFSQIARSGGAKRRHAGKQSFIQDIASIVGAICDWIASIGYKTRKRRVYEK